MARKKKTKPKRSYILDLAARCLEQNENNPILIEDVRAIARQFEIIERVAATALKRLPD